MLPGMLWPSPPMMAVTFIPLPFAHVHPGVVQTKAFNLYGDVYELSFGARQLLVDKSFLAHQ